MSSISLCVCVYLKIKRAWIWEEHGKDWRQEKEEGENDLNTLLMYEVLKK